jgi:hypothetical protein
VDVHAIDVAAPDGSGSGVGMDASHGPLGVAQGCFVVAPSGRSKTARHQSWRFGLVWIADTLNVLEFRKAV